MKYILTLLVIASTFLSATGQELKTYEGKEGSEDDFESIMIALNGGCSLGCAIGWSLEATSTLPDQGSNTYKPDNMDDDDRKTAWVEGQSDYGIGSRIIITFNDVEGVKGVPFDAISITNGYAKSQSSWEANSRVKLFKVYLNGQAQFFIKLKDSIYPQWVYWSRDFIIGAGDQVEFEIVDVYPGTKWKDTAISDLSLSGAH